jgi:hypothetical protein
MKPMHYSSMPSGFLGQGQKKNVTQVTLTAQHPNAFLCFKKKSVIN